MKGRLRDRLDSLPPRVRLKVVLVMFGLFALCSLYIIGSAIINFGNGKEGVSKLKIQLPKVTDCNYNI